MRKIHYLFISILAPLILVSLVANVSVAERSTSVQKVDNSIGYSEPKPSIKPTTQPSPTSAPSQVPDRSVIPLRKHMYQTFNNCGPASLSMLLSYYEINESQQVLGEFLRPLQNPQGNNDDKSVSLKELADYAEDNYDLIAYQRPGGDMDMLKRFISNDIPVVVRSWLNLDEDIGHYRLIRGYDDTRGVVIQDDSYQGKELEFSYSEFEMMWMPFSWEFMVLANEDQVPLVEDILGERLDTTKAWEYALQRSSQDNPNFEDRYELFNISRANYYLGNYQTSITIFEQVEAQLPFRMLWYQYEPILSYLEAGQYQRVYDLTSEIINNNNLAYSELYIIRGKAYEDQGRYDLAKQEFNKAILYNKNLEEPRLLLDRLEGN